MTAPARTWLHVHEVAWLLQRTERQVRRLVAAGDLTELEPRIGHALRIPVTELTDALKLRAAWWLGAILTHGATAPRADRPWQLPPPLPRCGSRAERSS